MFDKRLVNYKNNHVDAKWLTGLELPKLTLFKKCES